MELAKIGVYAGALIKKRRYWPKHVPGDMIDARMATKEVGQTDSLYGKLDDVDYDIFCMKEPDYVMKIMSTYGGLTVPQDQPESTRVLSDGTTKTFQYMIPFANHFKY